MSIEEEIVRLGGIQPLEEQYYPLSDAEIAEVEREAGSKLPEEYTQLLSRYGAFLFVNSVEFMPSKQEPEYVHSAELDLPSGSFSGSQVSAFYGKQHKTQKFVLLQKLQVFRDRMPEGFLPFADDGLGNQLCLGLKTERDPRVYWWDHELEWGAEDYEEELGVPMPVEAKYQNVYLVASNITEFFEKLIVSAFATD